MDKLPDQVALRDLLHAVKQLPVYGNTIPARWWREIVTPKGRPNPAAVLALSDVVWWYTPEHVYNDDGELTGYRKRFKGRALHRTARQLADRFGFSPNSMRAALAYLDDEGFIARALIHEEGEDGRKIGNKPYIWPIPTRIAQITDPLYQKTPPGVGVKTGRHTSRSVTSNSASSLTGTSGAENDPAPLTHHLITLMGSGSLSYHDALPLIAACEAGELVNGSKLNPVTIAGQVLRGRFSEIRAGEVDYRRLGALWKQLDGRLTLNDFCSAIHESRAPKGNPYDYLYAKLLPDRNTDTERDRAARQPQYTEETWAAAQPTDGQEGF